MNRLGFLHYPVLFLQGQLIKIYK